MFQSIFLFLAVILLAFATLNAFADGDSNAISTKSTSATQMDKRLPPVLPGEEIKTEGGTIKVWSSAGSPTQGKVVAPPTDINPNNIPNNIGVMVDRRDGFRDNNHHNHRDNDWDERRDRNHNRR